MIIDYLTQIALWPIQALFGLYMRLVMRWKGDS